MVMEKNADEITDVQRKFFELIAMADAEGGKSKVLSIEKRLNYFHTLLTTVYELEMNSMLTYYVGITKDQNILLEKSTEVERLLYFNYIALDYNFTYSKSVHKGFHEARLDITDYFIKNYQITDRSEIYNHLIGLNKELEYLGMLSENTNVQIYPDTVFSAFLNSLLSQLYILTENYSDAFGSMMNASFFYGMLQERYSPIPNEKIDEFVNASLSAKNRERSLGYWNEKNKEKESLKVKYLEIMKKEGFSKYSDAAEHIYLNANPEQNKYRYIYDALREADK